MRPAAVDAGRYRRFEAFLKESGLVPSLNSVDRIVTDVKQQGNGFADLIVAVVQSESFRAK